MSVRAQEPVSEPQPLTLKRRQPRPSCHLIGGGMSKGGVTHSSPPRMISALGQLSSAPSRRPRLPRDPMGLVRVCTSVASRPDAAAGRCGSCTCAQSGRLRAIRAESASPGTPWSPRAEFSHSLPPGSRLSKRLLRVAPGGPRERLQSGPLVHASLRCP